VFKLNLVQLKFLIPIVRKFIISATIVRKKVNIVKIIIIFVYNLNGMIVTFEKEYLQELYETGKTTDKKRRFQPEITTKYIQRIKILEKADRIEDLFVFNSLHYEALQGNKLGILSIRVNLQYRIEFTVNEEESGETIITVCNILELSNHYK